VPTVALGEKQVGYDVAGAGPTVLLLNGIGASRQTSAFFAARLADEGFHAVTLDNPGAGESDRVDGACTPRRLADTAARLLDHLGLSDVHVFGPSMGGAIAQELAVARPDLVRSLQLHCTWARTDPYLEALFRSWRELVHAVGPVAVWKHMLLWAVTPAFYAGNPDVVAGFRAMVETVPQSTVEGFSDHADACIIHDALGRLESIQVPVLATAGERDLIARIDHLEELAAQLPGALTRIWPAVGHLPWLEAAPEFEALCLEFLRGS
jgi:3-oxoadipate enol-lactonase